MNNQNVIKKIRKGVGLIPSRVIVDKKRKNKIPRKSKHKQRLF